MDSISSTGKVKPRDRLETFTIRAAKKLIERDDSIRAAVMFGPDTPLVDSASTRVRLFEKVGDADKYLRAMLKTFEEDGWVKVWGTLNYGVFDLERDGKRKYIALTKRPR